MPWPDGLVILDKPAGRTSHDMVSLVRRLAATRRVGHAGTLDPCATGVLVLGVGKATRLLTYLVGCDKSYVATIRLGAATVTDDAEGEVTEALGAWSSGTGLVNPAGLDPADPTPAVLAAMAGLTGAIEQVPSAVSAIKVGGRRAYARVRAGEEVSLPARPVEVARFDLLACRPEGDYLDLDVAVGCSSGTYVRALARDLGTALGVGGHVTALRRLRVGPYTADQAVTVEALEAAAAAGQPPVLPLAQAAAARFPVRQLTGRESQDLSHGLTAAPSDAGQDQMVAGLAPDGALVALLRDQDGRARPVVVFA
ncbi:MAG: tRNA pseudouridine(55) synthase TruB [Bifidobacteriaceae bacterium]|jgi:tRNA pseudouridine55 synthase|nr:tRNA pseudouridine(55) synthase TruB [Bifidobacteriaceae bacterium]